MTDRSVSDLITYRSAASIIAEANAQRSAAIRAAFGSLFRAVFRTLFGSRRLTGGVLPDGARHA